MALTDNTAQKTVELVFAKPNTGKTKRWILQALLAIFLPFLSLIAFVAILAACVVIVIGGVLATMLDLEATEWNWTQPIKQK